MSTNGSIPPPPCAGPVSYRPISYLSPATGVTCVFETTEQKGDVYIFLVFFS